MKFTSGKHILYFILYYLYFMFLLLPTWRIKPDDKQEQIK